MQLCIGCNSKDLAQKKFMVSIQNTSTFFIRITGLNKEAELRQMEITVWWVLEAHG